MARILLEKETVHCILCNLWIYRLECVAILANNDNNSALSRFCFDIANKIEKSDANGMHFLIKEIYIRIPETYLIQLAC